MEGTAEFDRGHKKKMISKRTNEKYLSESLTHQWVNYLI